MSVLQLFFNFAWWNLNELILCFFIILLYAGAIRFQRRYRGEAVPRARLAAFALGAAAFTAGWASPLFALGHVWNTAHMIRMSLLYFVAPPLLIAGCPAWLLQSVLRRLSRHRPLRRAANPMVALWLFNALFILYHVPFVFDHVMIRPWAHHWFFAALTAVSLWMWYPLASPLPEHQLAGKRRKAYISANGWILMPACALVLFSNQTLFEIYRDPSLQFQALGSILGGNPLPLEAMPRPVSAIQDQRWGSLCMILFHSVSFGWFRRPVSVDRERS